MTIDAVIAAMTSTPARIFGLPGGRIAAGAPADLMIFDPNASWRIDADASVASAGNTPFDGMAVEGRVFVTVKGGDIVWSL
jgi:dihydroorotase